MKRSIVLIGVFILHSFCLFAQGSFNLMTFNLRYNNPQDSSNAWPLRKDKVCSQILFYEADILGIQEGLKDQMNDLKNCLEKFDFTGIGRDDGKEKGEYSAIFYNRDKFSLLNTGTFWLSPTPHVPGSMGWDAACTRICTWALFTEKENKKSFYVFNTHLDHVGSKARIEGIKMILAKIDSVAGKYPVIFMGDLNSGTDDAAVQQVTNPKNPVRFYNSKDISKEKHFGPEGTFNAFKSHEQSASAIDHIFLTGTIEVLKHATLSESWMGHFSSDHFPVFARIHFN